MNICLSNMPNIIRFEKGVRRDDVKSAKLFRVCFPENIINELGININGKKIKI